MGHPADGMAAGIGYGAMAASAALLLGFTHMDSEPLGWDALLYMPVLAGITVMVALLLILLAATVLGLPLVWLLKRIDCASAEVISLTGAMAGAALFLVPAELGGDGFDPVILTFVLAAMIGGGVTGAVWGTTLERQQPDDDFPPHPNRLHDERILR